MEGKGPLARRFIVDEMLGKLARWLRLLGFDAPCRPLDGLEAITAQVAEGRIPVTRNHRWREIKGVLWLRCNETGGQLRELLLNLEIGPDEIDFLSRCVACSHKLEAVSRSAVLGLVPDYVFETSSTFSRCGHCGKLYWYGTHPSRMLDQFRCLVKGTRLEGWEPGVGRGCRQ